MAAKAQSRAATPRMMKVEREFIEAALSKVRTPHNRYLLTIGLDALADILSCVESEPGQPATKRETAAPKRRRAR